MHERCHDEHKTEQTQRNHIAWATKHSDNLSNAAPVLVMHPEQTWERQQKKVNNVWRPSESLVQKVRQRCPLRLHVRQRRKTSETRTKCIIYSCVGAACISKWSCWGDVYTSNCPLSDLTASKSEQTEKGEKIILTEMMSETDKWQLVCRVASRRHNECDYKVTKVNRRNETAVFFTHVQKLLDRTKEERRESGKSIESVGMAGWGDYGRISTERRGTCRYNTARLEYSLVRWAFP